MKFGEKIIFMERWPYANIKVLFYLFEMPIEYDPFHHTLCCTNEKFISLIPDFNTYIEKKDLLNGDELYFIDNKKYSKKYTKNQYEKQTRILNYFIKNKKTIELLFGTEWNFYEEKIRSFDITYHELVFRIKYFAFINISKRIFTYIILPLLAFPLLDLYFLLRSFSDYRIVKLKINIKKQTISKYEKYALSKPQLEEKKKLEESIENDEANLSKIKESMLASNRSFSTLILGLLTLLFTVIYFQNKEAEYINTILKKDIEIKELFNELNTEKEKLLNLKLEFRNLKSNK
ncbi:hypothetical protein LFX15_18930 [Leptospira levettii]|uniref:hypothetical protein n=1 Tax=Leptospira levettii TaxID=2023178 RepID=UPI001EEB7012|nr:hypothetical protein [Leptospira levettii]MCG6150377.1 hypothetical protein [Leptospira levettii]